MQHFVTETAVDVFTLSRPYHTQTHTTSLLEVVWKNNFLKSVICEQMTVLFAKINCKNKFKEIKIHTNSKLID